MVKKIVIHHCGGSDLNPLLDTSEQPFEVVNDYHRQKWNFKSTLGYYIGYQYYIDKYGKVTQGRADLEEGAHTIGLNKESIGICLAGNFDVTFPTPAQIESLKSLLKTKLATYGLKSTDVVPHRTYAAKTCYGRNLSDTWARDLLIPVASTTCVSEKAEVASLKQSLKWYEQFFQKLFK
jgi:hypothetical protein